MRSDIRLALVLTVLATLVVTDMTCYRCMDLVVDNENITIPDVSHFIFLVPFLTFQDFIDSIKMTQIESIYCF